MSIFMASIGRNGAKTEGEIFSTITLLTQRNGICVMTTDAFVGMFLLKVLFRLIVIRRPLAFLMTLMITAEDFLVALPME